MFEKINNFFSSKKNSNLIREISDKYLNNINQLEADISNLSKEEMTHKIENLKQNYISNQKEELSDEDISFACALLREISKRTIVYF